MVDYWILPHTHWDREWYLTFQEFRWKLVRTIDGILDTLERDETFAHFMLDGQTAVVEDYLELEGTRRDAISRFVQAGRLAVGPWYVQPDDLLVSGEALIRNLERGIAQARELGGAMMVGYLPDSFGHIGSLPSILRGFGIGSACLMRGPGRELDRALFGWSAKDGSRVVVANLLDGYGNGADLPADSDAIGAALVEARERQREALLPGVPLLVMNGFDHRPINPALSTVLARAGLLDDDRQEAAAKIGPLHAYLDIAASTRAVPSEARPEPSSPSALGSRPFATLPEWRGELRSVYRAPINAGCTSSRQWIKAEDQAISTLLERQAEPLAALASLVGAPYPASAIDLAWKYLLLNQPHDSICGCSIDAVHEDMKYRYAQARGLAQGIIADASVALARAVDTSFAAPDVALVVLNPAPRRVAYAIEVELPDVPADAALMDASGKLHSSQILAASGEPSLFFDERLSPAQIRFALGLVKHGELMSFRVTGARASWESEGVLGVELKLSEAVGASRFDWDAWVESMRSQLADPRLTSVHAVGLRSGPKRVLFSSALPAFGATAFALRPPRTGEAAAVLGELRAGRREIENARFRVRVAWDGSIELFDKRAEVAYPGIGRFSDEGDRGDEYNFDAVPDGRVVSRPARRRLALGAAIVRLVERGPIRATLRIDADYRVPAALSRDRRRRSRAAVRLRTTRWISLCAGSSRVELRIEIDNRASDHRLRVHVPLPGSCTHSEAGGTFELVRRSARPEPAPAGEKIHGEAADLNYEEPPSTHPATGFVAAPWRDAKSGRSGAFAVLARGLREYEIVERRGRSEVAITLFRSVGWLSRADLSSRRGQAGPDLPTPGAQEHGVRSFEFAFVGFEGPVAASEVPAEWEDFRSPAGAFTVTTTSGRLGGNPSLLEIEGEGLMFSSLRRLPSGALSLRFYDLAGAACRAAVRAAFPIAAVWKTRLDGTRLIELPLGDGGARFEVPTAPFEIVTLEISPAPRA